MKFLFGEYFIFQKLKWPVVLFLSALVIFYLIRYGLVVSEGGNEWLTGDWLINYECGFIRRGLFGQIILTISNHLNLNILLVAYLFQSFFYVFIFVAVLNLFFKKKRENFWFIFLVSPAFIFFFPFNDFWGGFRKEIIVFSSFLLLLISISDVRVNKSLATLSLILFALGVFSHEMTALLLPFFIYVLYSEKFKECPDILDFKKHFKIRNFIYDEKFYYSIMFSFFSILGLSLSLFYSGTIEQSKSICDSLLEIGLKDNMCSGSISWISNDYIYAFNFVRDTVIEKGYIYYAFYFVLSIFPFLMLSWTYQRKVIVLFFVVLISFVPLFLLAIDWGRWIHIIVFMFTMTLVYDDNNTSKPARMTVKINPVLTICLIVVFMFWRLPKYGNVDLKFGVLNTIIEIFKTII